ncbi:MAG: oligosaccharide flippase family protein [Ruminococcus sp.]|nr:oligosaccharide flippase family protein [Ruminococcus sp.]
MAGKLKKNGFVEGAVITYGAIVITKILGALYNIPFYEIIGDRGSIIYSFAYNIYVLFLDISTSGIPIAISIVISEYASKGMYRTKEKAYSLGLKIVVAVSVAAFIILQLFASQLAGFYIADMTDGVTVNEVAVAIRAVSFCLLIVPFLSMKRGYLQGHKCLSASSTSQVIEQIVRIVFVLAGASLVVYAFKLSTTVGVCVALFGASVGAAVALVYLLLKSRKNKELFQCEVEAEPDSTKNILKKIFTYCLSIVLVSVSSSVYSIVDMKLLLVGLHSIGYSAVDTQTITSIASTWIPKICMIVTALSMGLTNSIAPHIAESFSKGRMNEVGFKINQGMGTIIVVSIPMAAGIIALAEPVYRVFYGYSDYGATILMLAVAMNVIGSVVAVVSMAMQSIDMGKHVVIFTIVGMFINAGLDLPFIYLFEYMGIPAYLGATTASVVGYSITLFMLLASLWRKYKVGYMPTLKVFLKIIVPTASMIAVVMLLKFLLPVVESRGILLVLQLGLYALVGAAVYGFLAYRFGAITDVMDLNKFKGVLRKLHLTKK